VNWSVAFAKHLAVKGLSQQDALFALRLAGIKATQSSISYWARGATYPREQTRRQIEKWSGGKVRANLPAAEPESGTDVTTERRAVG